MTMSADLSASASERTAGQLSCTNQNQQGSKKALHTLGNGLGGHMGLRLSLLYSHQPLVFFSHTWQLRRPRNFLQPYAESQRLWYLPLTELNQIARRSHTRSLKPLWRPLFASNCFSVSLVDKLILSALSIFQRSIFYVASGSSPQK